MKELDLQVVDRLVEDDEFVTSRVRPDDGSTSWLLTTPIDPRGSGIEKLRHAYALRDELDLAYSARPLELTEYQGRPALLTEDPGGVFMSDMIGSPMPAREFLHLAIAAATALDHLHRLGLIHRDIKPTNLIVDAHARAVRLTGFGVASRPSRLARRPDAALGSLQEIAGTLAYMSPEQTGRTGRSIDARSDLYSLGVTLYEQVVGLLPFTAGDAMEWVHCHLARTPPLPSARAPHVPEMVSAVIMKLLAKAPEDRYQSAAGLVTDLRRCLDEWESRGRIETFPLGAREVSGRLFIQARLYGREKEVKALLSAFDRVSRQGHAELVLVSGYSGVGKSSLVNELQRELPPTSLFASGKFDQYKRDIPYATLAQAFQGLIRQILGGSEERLTAWRLAIQDALGPNARLITDLVPELKYIVGDPAPAPELPPQDAQRRFHLMFRRFIGVFAQPDHPLVLFVDDLQWLDAATLGLVEDLLTQSDMGHLLLVGAYRDNEVGATHPLARKLASLRAASADVSDIALAPLSSGHLTQLIADALQCRLTDVTALGDVVYAKTQGNPFFAIQFLAALADEDLIRYDHARARWSHDLDGIHAKGYTDNVVDLMIGKLDRLPDATRSALQHFACFGNAAELHVLALVLDLSEEQVHAALLDAMQLELVERLPDGYRFAHDRVQEAAYLPIPESVRAETHLRIGRLYLAHTPPDKREERVFEIVNQLNRGEPLITRRDEREKLAKLNLTAGLRAKASTAYTSAIHYLSVGADLIDSCRKSKHDLLFALELHRAECEFLTGALTDADERLKTLSTRATTTVDRAVVARLRVDLYTTLDQSDLAVTVGLDYLRHLGIDWSPHPTQEDVRREYADFKARLGHRTIEDLIDLPLMTDAASLATMDVLCNIMAPALFTDRQLFALVTCRAVNLSLAEGNCHGSCFVYLWMGPSFDDYQEGFRFAKLSLDLVNTRGLDRFKPRVYMHFGNIVNQWARPFHAGREWIQKGFEAANENGDLTFVAYGCNHMVSNLIASGEPLAELQREAEDRREFARQARFGLVVDIITAQRQLVRMLRGLTAGMTSFDDAEFDDAAFERHLEDDARLAIATCWYWVRKLQASVFAGDFATAELAASKAEPLMWTCPWHLEVAEFHFYAALARAAPHLAPGDDASDRLGSLERHHALLREWAANSPENFTNRAALVGAEIARLGGRTLDAERLYEDAIGSARTHGLLHNEALACELAARFHRARGFETISHAYLRDAHHAYVRWGAEGKVRQLEEAHPRLREDRIPNWLGLLKAPIEDLDLVSLAKSAEAISEQIVLSKLIGMLLRLAVESAGAQRGLLILLDDGGPRIEAEAMVEGGQVEVTQRQSPVSADELPMAMLQFTMRTRELVLLDDASTRHTYSEDDYVKRRRPRSVLCLPIVKQTRLMGVLYLENNLAPQVFTMARVSMLNLLASRAAISLENARLYADLERENAERRRIEAELRRSERLMSEGQRIGRTGSWAWNVRTGELRWSQEQRRIFGFDEEADLRFEQFAAAIHPDDRPAAMRAVEDAAKEALPFDHEYRIVLPDRAIKYIRGSGRPVMDESGQLLEYFGAVLDISEQQRTESALESALARATESEDQLRTLIDRIPCHAWTADAGGSVEFYSRRWLDYVGMSSEEARGTGWVRTIHPEDAANLTGAWQDILESRLPGEMEARMRRHDGAFRWYLFRAAPAITAGGEIVKWYGTNIDIDELKRAERFLAGEKRLFEMIATGAPLQTTLRTLCEIVEDMSEGSLVSILLMDEDGKRLRHCAAPSLPASYTDAVDGSLIGPSVGSCGAAAYRGEKVYVSDIAQDPLWVDFRDLALQHDLRACWSTPILAADRSVLGTFALYARQSRAISNEEVRITEQFTHLASIVVERKRAQDALLKSEAFLAEAQRIAHVGYWERDLESNVITWSQETCRIFGLQTADGRLHLSQLSALIHPDDRSLMVQAIERALQGVARYDLEYRIVRPDGEVRFVHSMGDCLQEESGRTRRMFGTVQDITERKRTQQELQQSDANLRKVQAHLAHVTRVTTMGELAASIAHEVSQPLSGIVTSARVGLLWLSADAPNLNEARVAIQGAIRDGERAGEVISRIRKLFQKETTPKEPLDINEVIGEVTTLTHSELQQSGTALKLHLAKGLPRVLGDRVQIQQVLMNLVLNAVDAMSGVEGRPRTLSISTSREDSDNVRVEVLDSGPGIKPEFSQRVFEPFHTSKPGGMGMGLAICRTIVEDHGGRLRLLPNAEPGALFQFTLVNSA